MRIMLPTRVLTIGVALMLTGWLPVLAGPPFQTDDPEPVGYQHFEAYVFSTYDGTKSGSATQGPAYEMNWGVVPDVQLHLVIPAAASIPKDGPSSFGIGDTEVGVKFPFYSRDETPAGIRHLSISRNCQPAAPARDLGTDEHGIACRCGFRKARARGPPTAAVARC